MINLIQPVKAVFLFHRHSKQFLGESFKSGTTYSSIVPVNNIENALDFRIGELEPLYPFVNYVPYSEVVNSKSQIGMTISHPNHNYFFDVLGNTYKDVNRLVFKKSSQSTAEKVIINLLPDFSVSLKIKNSCIIFNELAKVFESGSCSNLLSSSFDLYMEADVRKELIYEEIYKLDNPKEPRPTDSLFRTPTESLSNSPILEYNSDINLNLTNPIQKNTIEFGSKLRPEMNTSISKIEREKKKIRCKNNKLKSKKRFRSFFTKRRNFFRRNRELDSQYSDY